MLDLLALAAPLEAARLPNGTEHQVHAMDGPAWQLYNALRADPANADLVWALVRRVIPSATEDDLASLAIEDMQNLIVYASRKLRHVEDARKNGSSDDGSTVPPSSPTASPPTTSSPSSSPG